MAFLPGRRGLTAAELILREIVEATREYDDCLEWRDWEGCDLASARLTAALEAGEKWHVGRCATTQPWTNFLTQQ